MATTNATFTYLKDWLEQTFDWLHADGLPEVLQKPHSQLIKIMLTAKQENRANEVWDLIDKLEKLALRTRDTREQGEIFLTCAKVAADLENLKGALSFFQAAEAKYLGFPHQHAIALWMTGCIHWAMGENVEAISSWQTAISLFQERQVNAQVDSVKAQWYIVRLRKLEEALAKAIDTRELPPCNLSAPFEAAQPEKPDTVSEQSSFEGDTLRWMSCLVSESVPAGGFGPTGFDPNPMGFLEISEVLIDEEPYQVYSVRRTSSRRNAAEINSQSHYQTVRVTGTSMNAAKPIPILDGDYVLVQSQPEPGDNEIVVAGIIGQDERATLKRLKRRNGKVRLVPETTDPKNAEIDWEKEFTELDEEFKIFGTVIAIFKKKPG